MSTITLSKTKYQDLKNKAESYELILRIIEGNIFTPPPTKNIKEIINEFKKTSRYNQKFISSLKKGLIRSSYFNQ